MSTPKTKLVGNPWTELSKTQAKKPAAKRPDVGKPGSGRVNVADLAIDHEAVYDPNWRAPRPPGKYDAIFEKLPIGKAIICKPEDCPVVAHNLRHWGLVNGKELIVKHDRNYHGTGTGRVFLIGEKEPTCSSKSSN